jgi:uncharacterized protein
VLRRTFVPSRALALGSESEVAAVAAEAPFARDKAAAAGRATAYVCHRGRCELPVTDPGAFESQLRARRS